MCISRHLPSRLECQQRGLNWNTLFIQDNLIGYHSTGDILIEVLSWFCLDKSGKAFFPYHRKGSSLIQQASERQRSSLRWVPGQLLEIPEVLICLASQVFSSRPSHGWDLVCWLLAFSYFSLNAVEILIEISLNWKVVFGSINFLTASFFPIHEHNISFHWFMSSLISFIHVLWFSE